MLTNKEKLKSLIPVLARKHNFRPAIVEKDYYLTVIYLSSWPTHYLWQRIWASSLPGFKKAGCG